MSDVAIAIYVMAVIHFIEFAIIQRSRKKEVKDWELCIDHAKTELISGLLKRQKKEKEPDKGQTD